MLYVWVQACVCLYMWVFHLRNLTSLAIIVVYFSLIAHVCYSFIAFVIKTLLLSCLSSIIWISSVSPNSQVVSFSLSLAGHFVQVSCMGFPHPKPIQQFWVIMKFGTRKIWIFANQGGKGIWRGLRRHRFKVYYFIFIYLIISKNFKTASFL